MQEVYLVGYSRTAFGKLGGVFKNEPGAKLAAHVLKDILVRTGVSADQVENVILGQTRMDTEAANIARYSLLLAGYPETCPGYSIMQQCSSGMQAVQNAADEIRLGRADLIVAGGVEALSVVPFYVKGTRYGLGVGNTTFVDPIPEGQINSQPVSMYGSFGMGMTAENIAAKDGITREEQDAFAFQSQSRYQAAMQAGKFAEEIAPYTIPQKKGDPIVIDKDEHPRLTPLDKLATLKPVFKADGTVTAANACGRNDGAAVVMLASEKKVKELGLKPIARFVDQAVAALDPRYMGLGPVYATKKLLARTGLTVDDIDLFELNEAFAAQSLGCIKELGLDQAKVNVNGGAIAIGHPMGATGARIIGTLALEMQRRGSKLGIATLCVGGGLGSATLIERV